MPVTKVLVVDDHELLRAGVRDFVGTLPGYELVGEADSARTALYMAASLKPDIVLMDIDLPGMDGIVATREILRRLPDARVIMLSALRRFHDVLDALGAGAVAYVLKADPPEMLTMALESAVRGARFVSPTVAPSLAALETRPPQHNVLDVLSEREREVFRLAADCHAVPDIARKLCLARTTVDAHLDRINRKLGLRDLSELVRLAAGMGLMQSIRSRPAEVFRA